MSRVMESTIIIETSTPSCQVGISPVMASHRVLGLEGDVQERFPQGRPRCRVPTPEQGCQCNFLASSLKVEPSGSALAGALNLFYLGGDKGLSVR